MPLNLIIRVQCDDFSGIDLKLDHLNNRLINSGNNLMSIDFCKRDWIDDTDLLLSRVAMEFPRISNKYKSKAHD